MPYPDLWRLHHHEPELQVIAVDAAPLGPMESVALQVGHRELLATLRELMAQDADPEVDLENLRAILAFLRQGVVPFARREEALLAGDPSVREGIAFEHAFLEAEIERLSAEAAVLSRVSMEDPRSAPAAGHRVRRTLNRIEAVLELHLDREGEREITAPPGGPAPARAPSPFASGREHSTDRLSAAEAERLLKERPWGVLSTFDGMQPYGVPVHYGFDGRYLYVASGPGRKADNLAAEPAVCLTVPDIADGMHWRCVVVTGQAHPLTSVPERIAAVRTLTRSAATGLPTSPTAWNRLAKSRLFRITPVEITGRRRNG